MIDIQKTGMCENCNHADLKVRDFCWVEVTANGTTGTIPHIYCSHERVCEMWNKKLHKLEESLKREEKCE